MVKIIVVIMSHHILHIASLSSLIKSSQDRAIQLFREYEDCHGVYFDTGLAAAGISFSDCYGYCRVMHIIPRGRFYQLRFPDKHKVDWGTSYY